MTGDPKARIATEALHLFNRHGFKHVTMAQIAARLSMSKKTLYQHFDSKEALIGDVIERLAGPWLAMADDVIAHEPPFLEAVGRLSGFVDALSQNVSRAMLDDMEIMPDVWPVIEARREDAVAKLVRILELGQRQGIVRADVEAALVIRVLINALNTFGTPRSLADLGLMPSEFAYQILTLFFDGIRAPAQPFWPLAPERDVRSPVFGITA